eukprot:264456-Chlamydomonas_euryale.AAC.1
MTSQIIALLSAHGPKGRKKTLAKGPTPLCILVDSTTPRASPQASPGAPNGAADDGTAEHGRHHGARAKDARILVVESPNGGKRQQRGRAGEEDGEAAAGGANLREGARVGEQWNSGACVGTWGCGNSWSTP